MEKISKPKNSGGWGLLDLRSFGKALLCKSLWRGIYGEGPWSSTIKMKYMGGKEMAHWYRLGRIGSKHGSAIWLSFRKIEHYFLKNLIWSFQSGSKIIIGIDPFISEREKIYIPENLLSFFHRKGFFTWDKLIASWQGPVPMWIEADSLGMCDSLARQWNSIRDGMRSSGLFRSLPVDVLVWKVPNAKSQVCVKDIYINLIGLKIAHASPLFPPIFWRARCPPKFIFFAWLVFYNKNLSWENLKKGNWHGPGFCLMCGAAEESNFHMFFQCQKTRLLWYELAVLLGFPDVSHASTQEAFIWWSGQRESWRSIIIIVLWYAWKWRNNIIFRDKREPFMAILRNVVSLYESLPAINQKRKNVNWKGQGDVPSGNPRAFFDGAAQLNSCGCGVHIIMDEGLHYLISWNGGKGSNCMAEAMALARLLTFCIFFDIHLVSIYGDSEIVVDHVLGKCPYQLPSPYGLDGQSYVFVG